MPIRSLNNSTCSTYVDESLLVSLGGGRLIARHKSGADPDGLGTPRERRGETPAIVDATGSDNVNRF